MKKIFLTIIAIAAVVFNSCSNKVDLYSDEGETTVVYAMFDAGADTNFVKITKSFIGNANDLTHNYEASNYAYDEIDVTLSGVFDGSPATQTITLDTIAKWIPYDESATFYSGCWQRYYYTTAKLLEGKEYTIDILRKTDNTNISASTTTVNSFAISKPFISQKIKFKDVKRGTVEWRVADITTFFQSTAAYFEVTGYFHYSELMPGKQDTVHRYITWPLGSGESEKLYNSTDRYYLITYTPEAIYDVLESNDYLKNNSPSGVKRWFDKFEFKVSAIGDELYNYHIINNSSSAIQDVPNYSNVENGIGLVSTRISKSIRLTIEETSRKKVCEDFNYGFIYDPNR